MRLIISLLCGIMLSACSSKDSRYKDTAMLERPPILANRQSTSEVPLVDNSSIPKKRHDVGLGSDVYLTTTTPVQIVIKQPFDDA